jgi:hypothetical protein
MSDIKVIINHVGQTVIGRQVKSDKDTISLRDPAILHVVPNQTGQLQVQLIPLFFREFLATNSKEGATFNFPLDKIVTTDAELDARLTLQYERIVSGAPASVPQQKTGGESPVIKLFDE